MEILGLLLRWAHLFCAITLVGGLIYQRFVLLPIESKLDTHLRDDLRHNMRSKWSRVVMICTGLLLLSGLINFVLTMRLFDSPYVDMPSIYHMLFGLKFLAAMGIFFLAAILSGKREKSEKFRREPGKWLNIALVLALIVVIVSGVMRGTHNLPKVADDNVISTTEDQ